MTTHEFARSDLAARLLGTDASFSRHVIESAGSSFELDDQRNDPALIEVSPTITLSPGSRA